MFEQIMDAIVVDKVVSFCSFGVKKRIKSRLNLLGDSAEGNPEHAHKIDNV